VLALLGPERVAELLWEMLGPEGLTRLYEVSSSGVVTGQRRTPLATPGCPRGEIQNHLRLLPVRRHQE
jgi:hypothetical protein